jgi:CBS domain-containing protein
LVGILPTIEQSDIVLKNLTPLPRYIELNRILTELQGDDRIIHIKGLDELTLHMNDVFTEFCNTSFQVHLQVPSSEFVNYYNWAQAVTAPVLACAVNSPLFLGHRLWSETRLALFQHATDTRSPIHQARSMPTRVNFGSDWIKDSIIEMFHEDLARFRILLTRDIEENAVEVVNNGGIPKLKAWAMHNGTVWRWNRVCYGVMNQKPSFRIEARYLPSGPTILDEMANSAFFLGLMIGLPKVYGDVRDLVAFDDIKDNYYSAGRFGLKSQLVWFNSRGFSAKDLILEELLPVAREGLESVNVDGADIEKYLGVIKERVRLEQTGSRWMLNSLAGMDKKAKLNVRMRTITSELLKNQETKEPVHKWKLATIEEKSDWVDNYRTVERFMSKDLFTVRPRDIIDFAASMMNWKHIRHVPVEDDAGNLVGLVSVRELLEVLATDNLKGKDEIAVRDIMKTEVMTISPETPALEALGMMEENDIGCLPIVRGRKLIGIITAHDFLTVSAKLFEERLRKIDEQ